MQPPESINVLGAFFADIEQENGCSSKDGSIPVKGSLVIVPLSNAGMLPEEGNKMR